MTDRDRSRSPDPNNDGNGNHNDNNQDHHQHDHPADGGGDSGQQQHDASQENGEGGGDDAAGVKLYVGNLDYSTDETSLRNEFGKFGTVTEVFLPVERGTQRPRGFGFVTLQTREAAENAISKMDQAQLDGRTIRVNESRPKGTPAPGGGGGGGERGGGGGNGRGSLGPGGSGGFNSAGKEEVKLYVGNLSFDTTAESIQKIFEQYGTVTDCFMPSDRDSGRPRGFCFVTMPAQAAELACEKLNGYDLDGRAIRVNEAQPKGGGGGGGGTGNLRRNYFPASQSAFASWFQWLIASLPFMPRLISWWRGVVMDVSLPV